ncbi:MAG: class C sortase [Bifidobacteriaceae bacterium]|nr:class C sortase [Bifidobacteriaceae bacterium]
MTRLHYRKAYRKKYRTQGSAGVIPLVAGVLAFVGACILLYPSAAAWVSQYNQSKIIVGNLADSTSSVAERAFAARELSSAEDYNRRLVAGAIYSARTNAPLGTGADSDIEYGRLLDGGDGLMGRLQIPSIDLDLPMYHGTEDATLLKGIGHLHGTSLPVGGKNTHAVLTGHRGLANAEMFTRLNEVRQGDEFTVSTFGRVLTYRVVRTQVVEPTDTRSLKAVQGKDLVTLVTCTPLGINTQRIFVTGERVIPSPQEAVDSAGARPEIPTFPWWGIILATIAFADIGVVVWVMRKR